MAKTFDDTIARGETVLVKIFIVDFNVCLKARTLAHGPGRFRLFALNITQKDLSPSTDADEKMISLKTYPATRSRLCEVNSCFNSLEKSSFMSLSSCFGCQGLPAMLFFPI